MKYLEKGKTIASAGNKPRSMCSQACSL